MDRIPEPEVDTLMTRALIVYESVFGDARAIAWAVAAGLAETLPIEIMAAADAPAQIDPEVGLIVVGAPNHGFGLPRPTTRLNAVDQNNAVIADPRSGLREWLESTRLTRSTTDGGTVGATFDTRQSGHPLLTRMDHAAHTAEKLLAKLGVEPIAPAEHFFVTGTEGPLVAGEEDRARYWGRVLADLVSAPAMR